MKLDWLKSDKTRKFAREVGSIVLGVLIALGIGEIAESVRWDWRIGVSRTAMHEELSLARYNMVEFQAIQPCLSRHLQAIGAVLKEARTTHQLPRIEKILTPGRRAFDHAAYDAAINEGVLIHMPRKEASEFASFYLMLGYYDAESQATISPWATLSLAENAPGPIDGDLLTNLLSAWAEARRRVFWVGRIAQQVDDGLAQNHIEIDGAGTPAGRAELRASLAGSLPHYCAPLIVDGKPFVPPPGAP